jgi:hypothetical protein
MPLANDVDTGYPFVGMLFTGFMLTASGPKVLEYNVRFGDPETEALMLLLSDDTDLADIMLVCPSRSFALLSDLFCSPRHALKGGLILRTSVSKKALRFPLCSPPRATQDRTKRERKFE